MGTRLLPVESKQQTRYFDLRNKLLEKNYKGTFGIELVLPLGYMRF